MFSVANSITATHPWGMGSKLCQ